MKMTVRAAMLLGLTVALFQDSLAYGQTAVASTFQVVPTPNQNFNSELLAASASSPNDIWAVGQSTIHFEGATWTAFPAPMIKGDNNSFLQGVVDISPTLAWAAGNVTDGAHPGQAIEQWNGSKWSLFPGPKFGKKDQADVFAMTASSANDVWAIGSLVNLGTGDVSPLFEHWNGTAWTATTGESNNQFLFGASADTANDAWAVGFNGSDNIETLAMHCDGTSLAVIPSPNVGPNGANQSNRLFGLTANSPNDIWAFGSYFPSDESGHQMTLLLHWDGTSWTVASSPSPTKGGFPCDLLWAGVAPSPGNVWILGAGHDETLALHMTTGGNSGLVSSFSTGPLTR